MGLPVDVLAIFEGFTRPFYVFEGILCASRKGQLPSRRRSRELTS